MGRSEEFYGAGGDIEKMFPETKPATMVPWDQMGRRRDRQDYDRNLVAQTVAKPPTPDEMHEFDPGGLRLRAGHLERRATGADLPRPAGQPGRPGRTAVLACMDRDREARRRLVRARLLQRTGESSASRVLLRDRPGRRS